MISLLFASHDGHTRKIAHALAGHLMAQGRGVSVTDLGSERADPVDLEESACIALIAPIRYGYHLRPVEAFIKGNRKTLERKKLAIASVNLTARKAQKNTAATNPYMRKWLRRHALNPDHAAVFGGYLNYSLYKLWERWVIRLIMKITGGPTDFSAVVDYTDWSMVEAFAKQIAALDGAEKEEAA